MHLRACSSRIAPTATHKAPCHTYRTKVPGSPSYALATTCTAALVGDTSTVYRYGRGATSLLRVSA
eukprot:6213543-Pleurochrysis_carterae.AAC.1